MVVVTVAIIGNIPIIGKLGCICVFGIVVVCRHIAVFLIAVVRFIAAVDDWITVNFQFVAVNLR